MSEHRRDHGVVLVIVALSLTVLMVFAAFAVDLGALRTARRKAQGTVDGGALGGGQLLVTEHGLLTGATTDAIATEIIELTHLNMTGDAAMSDAGATTLVQWRNRFVSCRDAERDPTRFPVTSEVSECISFNSRTDIRRVRVRLPDLNVPAYFGSVVGFGSLDAHAQAEVELVPNSSGGVLPFGLLTGSDASEICLKRTSNPTVSPCDRPEQGNFKTLDFYFFGNPVLGTPSVCHDLSTIRLEVNIAIGIDHRLSTYAPGLDPIVHETVACPDLALEPNQLDGTTGLRANTLDLGLIEGIELDGHDLPGRLASGPWASADVRHETPSLDDRPLWDFIDPTLTADSAPPQCVPSITTISSRTQMAACLDAYNAGSYSAPLFAADTDGIAGPDILRSPRLAWVPHLRQTAWGPGVSDPYEIVDFRPIFLQSLFFCNGGTCDRFDPGEALPPRVPKGRNSEALTAMLLPKAALPAEVHARGPMGVVEYSLVLRR